MADDGFNLGILTRLGASERSFAAGQTIFHEGDTAEELFVIRKGRVDIDRVSACSINSAKTICSAKWRWSTKPRAARPRLP